MDGSENIRLECDMEQDSSGEPLQALLRDDRRKTLGVDSQGQFNCLKRGRKRLCPAICLAVILHGVLLIILTISWQHSVEKNKLLLMAQENAALKEAPKILPNSNPKLNAYLLIAPVVSSPVKKQTAPTLLEPNREEVQSSINVANGEPAEPNQEDSLFESIPNSGIVKAVPKVVPNTGNKEVRKQAKGREEDANKDVSIVIRGSTKDTAKVKVTGSTFRQFSQEYLERSQYRAIERLVNDEAGRYGQKRSMSELDGEMEPLWVSEFKPTVTERMQSIKSLDLGLDPNRRVRIGDTCYQVVKVATQINPYAENLGYAFNCGGDKVQLRLDKLITERLNKVR